MLRAEREREEDSTFFNRDRKREKV